MYDILVVALSLINLTCIILYYIKNIYLVSDIYIRISLLLL